MFTFHAFSSRLSPGLSSCPFPTKLYSFDKSKHSSDWNGSIQYLLSLLHTWPRKGYLLLPLAQKTGRKSKFGVLFGILFATLKKKPLDVTDTTRILSRGKNQWSGPTPPAWPTSLFQSPKVHWRPVVTLDFSPVALQHPPWAKKETQENLKTNQR